MPGACVGLTDVAARVPLAQLFQLLKDEGSVHHTFRPGLRSWLNDVRWWRNAFCHGVWFGFSDDGAGVFHCKHKRGNGIERIQTRVAIEELASLRARVVEVNVQVSETASLAGHRTAIAAVLPRRHELRSVPPNWHLAGFSVRLGADAWPSLTLRREPVVRARISRRGEPPYTRRKVVVPFVWAPNSGSLWCPCDAGSGPGRSCADRRGRCSLGADKRVNVT